MSQPLAERSAIITGASEGLGLEIAREYVRAGANVLICGRDAERLDRARAEIAEAATGSQTVVAVPKDVSDPEAGDQLVAAALERFGRLHILVNNAGIYGPIGPIETLDWHAWTRAIEINLYGSVLMSRAVLPHFKQHRYGKIVQVSGGGATSPLPRITAYAAAKAAVVRFAESLALEVEAFGIDVNAMAPGALNTRMMRELLSAGPEAVGAEFYERMKKTAESGGTPLSRGAELAVFLGAPASDGISGRLLSAVWDRWSDLPDHRDDMKGSDVYTLRRIVPADRGLDWEKS